MISYFVGKKVSQIFFIYIYNRATRCQNWKRSIWEGLPYLYEGYGQLDFAFDGLTSFLEEKFSICGKWKDACLFQGSWQLLVSPERITGEDSYEENK